MSKLLQLQAPVNSDKITETLKRMADMGIPDIWTPESYRSIVNCGFDSRTILPSFVLAQILEQNAPISVRGAFYRAVSAGLYPDTGDKHYRQASGIILALRRGGAVPYSQIADSTRIRNKPSSWTGLEDYQETITRCYRKDFWAQQSVCVEIGVEKDAMAGVLGPITREYDVALNVIRGNCSETFVYDWAECLNRIKKPVVVYYLGDHDPNGLDIERDLRSRLEGFCDRPIQWERLAITADDFHRDDLLGFPTRKTNHKSWQSRLDDYVGLYGDRCMEVDSIPPNEIRDRLRAAIEGHIDQAAWARLKDVEAAEKETIKAINWSRIGGAA